MPFEILPAQDSDKEIITQLLEREWGLPILVKKRTLHPQDMPAFKAIDHTGEIAGLLTYNIEGKNAEIVTMNSFKPNLGIGTALIKALKKKAREKGCVKIWLITTNDNIDAIRFYQMKGFRFAAIHKGAVDESRKTKKSIPETGLYGIPIRDEVEMDMAIT